MSTPSNEPTLTPVRRTWLLFVIALALMMVVSAVSGLNVALPGLARDTGATQSQLQWIVDAYTVVFAGLLLSAGAIGDRYGRKGILLAGLSVFGLAAGMAMFVDNPNILIGLRAMMGVGAAAVMPVTLSIITTSFPAAERPKAVGVWVGIAGAGGVLGLLGSGFLLEYFAWNSFFALNVSLAVSAIVGALLVVPASREAHPPVFDAPGSVLSLVTVASLVFAIIEGPERGWSDVLTVGAFGLGLLALAGFVGWELRNPEPMLDPRLFRLRGFGTGSLSITVQFFAAFGFLYVSLQYLQFVAGYSPLRAALALLPLPLVMIPLARRAPILAGHLGFNRVGAGGLASLAAGLLIVARVEVDFTYWHFAIGLVFFAVGMALAGAPATTAIVSSLPASKQGVASAVNDTTREFGSAIGIAVLGSVLNAQYRSGVESAVSGLPPAVAERARDSIAFVQSPAIEQLGPSGSVLAAQARQAFVDGVSGAMVVAAGALLIAAVLVAILGPRRGDVAVTREEHHREPAAGHGIAD